nr:MAG TPA: hypothetical protein [Caudoviricetes sp.]
MVIYLVVVAALLRSSFLSPAGCRSRHRRSRRLRCCLRHRAGALRPRPAPWRNKVWGRCRRPAWCSCEQGNSLHSLF